MVAPRTSRVSHRSHTDGLGMLRSGFTLIEILVVIVVIAVLAGLVAPNVFKHVGEAKNVTARSQIEMFGAALNPTASTTASTPPPPKGSKPCGANPQPRAAPSPGKAPVPRQRSPPRPLGVPLHL